MTELEEMMDAFREPFELDEVQWRPTRVYQDERCLAAAYADLRVYQQRLDEVAGTAWEDELEILDDEQSKVLCTIRVRGVTRCDVGTCSPEDDNTLTSAAAQAFKRAACKWGVGRFLYSIEPKWVDYDGSKKRITPDGERELARYLASQVEAVQTNPSPQPAQREASPPEEEQYEPREALDLEPWLERYDEAVRRGREVWEDAPPREGQRGLLVGIMEEALDGPDVSDTEVTDARHLILHYVNDSTSSHDLDKAETNAWLKALQAGDTNDPLPTARTELKMLLQRARWKEEQGEEGEEDLPF